MKLVLVLPLLVIPPTLVACYFVYLAPVARGQSAEVVGSRDGNLKAARIAYDRAGRFIGQARTGKGAPKELLLQAITQYNVCLAYASTTTDAGPLFDEARQNLEASRLLLIQQDRPVALAKAPQPPPSPAAPPVHAAPILPSETSSQPVTKKAPARDGDTENGQASAMKPVPERRAPEESPLPAPVKTIAVGPDGVTDERVEDMPAPKE